MVSLGWQLKVSGFVDLVILKLDREFTYVES